MITVGLLLSKRIIVQTLKIIIMMLQIPQIKSKVLYDLTFLTKHRLAYIFYFLFQFLLFKAVIFESAPISFEKKNLNKLDIIISEESVMDARPEEICSLNRNSGSKRNDFDSVGQDMVKSMMTYLLPQAVPLLEENSGRKKTATSNLETFPCGNVYLCVCSLCYGD